jgi:excisionase family DNA binding protein
MKKKATVTSDKAPASMTARELAAYLRVHPTTIYRLLKQGQIEGFHDRCWRFSIKTIDEWRSRLEASPSAGLKLSRHQASAHDVRSTGDDLTRETLTVTEHA